MKIDNILAALGVIVFIIVSFFMLVVIFSLIFGYLPFGL